MTSRTWEELVAEGRRLAAEAASPGNDDARRWAVGDLCIEAFPPGTTRQERTANQRQLEKFSAETGLSVGLLKDCYRTSEKWAPGSRFLSEPHGKHSRYASRARRVDLLLNDVMSDGLPERIRDKVDKVEEILADKQVREAVIERSRTRKRRILDAARVIEDEELTKARVELRIKEQNLKAELAEAEIRSKIDERTIKADGELGRMTYALIELGTYADQISPRFLERVCNSVDEIQRAACRALEKLRPATRSPQPRTVIDSHVDHQPGAEHR